jgi:hypothetical protein
MEDAMSNEQACLTHRVRRLERSNRRLMAGLFVGFCLSLVAFASQQGDAPAVLQAQRFQLVDDTGHVWIDLKHDSAETAIFLFDDSGTVRVGVAQFAHGGGGFALHGPQSRGAAVLYLRDQGSLTFYDAEDEATARFPVP